MEPVQTINMLIEELDHGQPLWITTDDSFGIFIERFPETVKILRDALVKIRDFHLEKPSA